VTHQLRHKRLLTRRAKLFRLIRERLNQFSLNRWVNPGNCSGIFHTIANVSKSNSDPTQAAIERICCVADNFCNWRSSNSTTLSWYLELQSQPVPLPTQLHQRSTDFRHQQLQKFTDKEGIALSLQDTVWAREWTVSGVWWSVSANSWLNDSNAGVRMISEAFPWFSQAL